jgi:hypothetical protein
LGYLELEKCHFVWEYKIRSSVIFAARPLITLYIIFKLIKI